MTEFVRFLNGLTGNMGLFAECQDFQGQKEWPPQPPMPDPQRSSRFYCFVQGTGT